MPRNFQDIINEVNRLPISLEEGTLLGGRRTSSLHSLEEDQAPEYSRSEPIQKALGNNVLSLFGGADVSALKNKEVRNLVIVDANPFVSKPSILQHCTEEDYDGFLHKNLGLFLLGNSPYLYATMLNHSDTDNPFRKINHFQKHYVEALSEPVYRTKYGVSTQDPFFDFVCLNSENTWKKSLGIDVTETLVDLGDIGLSTMILLRIRYCLNAEILEIEELKENQVFRIKIRRPDGTDASLFYASCTFGGTPQNQQTLTEVAQTIKELTGGISSVLIRGYPPFFKGVVQGELSRVGKEVKVFVQDSKVADSDALQCVVCTNVGDKLPDFFTHDEDVQLYSLPSKSENYQELVYICPGSALGLQSKEDADQASHERASGSNDVAHSNSFKAQLEKVTGTSNDLTSGPTFKKK